MYINIFPANYQFIKLYCSMDDTYNFYFVEVFANFNEFHCKSMLEGAMWKIFGSSAETCAKKITTAVWKSDSEIWENNFCPSVTLNSMICRINFRSESTSHFYLSHRSAAKVFCIFLFHGHFKALQIFNERDTTLLAFHVIFEHCSSRSDMSADVKQNKKISQR